MPTEIKIWSVSQNQLAPVEDVPLASKRVEKDLEDWIANDPDILEDDVLVIDRQRRIDGVGQLDLLCIDSLGTLVVVELKRDSTSREAIAQALDYASWLDGAAENQIEGFALDYLKRPLSDAFEERFHCKMPAVDYQRHRIILAAPQLDAAAERIINYLSNRYNVSVSAVFFKYATVAGQEILIRSMLADDDGQPPTGSRKKRLPLPGLLEMAEERGIAPLVSACREMRALWDEWGTPTHGGSIMYSLTPEQGWRSLFGINVSGQLKKAPAGELDVWVVTKNLAEVAHLSDDSAVRDDLSKAFPQVFQGAKCVIRLTTVAQAETLVKLLKGIAAGGLSQTAGA
ncbi:MAG: endonuclease NucS domain-containing protein [Bryobacteraceae bacterium]|jgi:hypothetical protein